MKTTTSDAKTHEMKIKKNGAIKKRKMAKDIKNNFKNNAQATAIKKDDDIVGVILRSQKMS